MKSHTTDPQKSSRLACKNCGTIRYAIKARQLCTRCYSVALGLEKIAKWDLSNPQTLKAFPLDKMWRREDNFKWLRSSKMQALSGQLDSLRRAERKLQKKISAYDLASMFYWVANKAGAQKTLSLRHYESIFAVRFSDSQRKILYEVLNAIRENLPWKWYDYGYSVGNHGVPDPEADDSA